MYTTKGSLFDKGWEVHLSVCKYISIYNAVRIYTGF